MAKARTKARTAAGGVPLVRRQRIAERDEARKLRDVNRQIDDLAKQAQRLIARADLRWSQVLESYMTRVGLVSIAAVDLDNLRAKVSELEERGATLAKALTQVAKQTDPNELEA